MLPPLPTRYSLFFPREGTSFDTITSPEGGQTGRGVMGTLGRIFPNSPNKSEISSLKSPSLFPNFPTKRSSRKGPTDDTASDSEHLDALREDGAKLNVAILDALGFGQVEGTKDSEDSNRSL